MKNIFIEAHKMTREIVEKYKVNYQVQFGLCVSYLLENKEEEKMSDLKGTQEQVKYAEDIKKDIINMMNELDQYVEEEKMKKYLKRKAKTLKAIEEIEDAKEMIENFKSVIYIKETLGKAIKVSEIFAKKDMLGQAVFTNSIDQEAFDSYYDKIDN